MPALPLANNVSILDSLQRNTVPQSARVSRIRAFGLDSRGSDVSTSPAQNNSSTPILAKNLLDGDVPTTVFSSRLDFGDANKLQPVNLFFTKDDDNEISDRNNNRGFVERSKIVQPIDDKVYPCQMECEDRGVSNIATC